MEGHLDKLSQMSSQMSAVLIADDIAGPLQSQVQSHSSFGVVDGEEWDIEGMKEHFDGVWVPLRSESGQESNAVGSGSGTGSSAAGSSTPKRRKQSGVSGSVSAFTQRRSLD